MQKVKNMYSFSNLNNSCKNSFPKQTNQKPKIKEQAIDYGYESVEQYICINKQYYSINWKYINILI